MELTLKLPVFEGPLDLLIHLIKKAQVDIYDIPIATITEQYLDYLFAAQELDMELASEFLVMAATLLSIKARMLLPCPPKEETGEEEPGIDPRQELVEQLLEYRRYKEAAAMLSERQELWMNTFEREGDDPSIFFPQILPPLHGVELSSLFFIFHQLLTRAGPEEPKVREIARERVTVQDKIRFLLALLQKERRGVSFVGLCDGVDRGEIVVTFLAVLELMKMRRIQVIGGQNDFFLFPKLAGGEHHSV